MEQDYDCQGRSHFSDNITIIKCALLGDGMTGKTCMMTSYKEDVFIHKYTATVSHECKVSQIIGDEQILLDVLDTAGQSDFEVFRAHTYVVSDVLILCFSVCDIESFTNILHFWLPEMKQYTKRKTPIILVGMQTDKRRNITKTEVGPIDGNRMAKLIGADVYVECSAKTGEGLEDVFHSVIESALRRRKRKNSLLSRLFHRKQSHV